MIDTIILVCLALFVGDQFGSWRTLKRSEAEFLQAKKDLKFWYDIATKLRDQVRGPIDSGIKWKDQQP